MSEYEELTGSGQFVKWDTVGQVVEGEIVTFTPDGGRDFDGDECPELTLSTDDGFATITCAQASLKRIVTRNADKLVPGAKCRVTFAGTYESKNGTPGKDFKVQLAPPAPVQMADLDAF